MSWDDLERDVDRMGRDARRVLDDARSFGEDLGEQVGLAGQEAAAAEYLATETVLEWVSGWAEDGAALAALQLRQGRYLLEDGVRTVRAAATARSPEEFLALPGAHLGRRRAHLCEGLEEAGNLLRRGLTRARAPLGAWRPFLAMVRRDWRGS
jgi:hypothetical protein